MGGVPSELVDRVPDIDLALAIAVAACGTLALLLRRRGGRFRELPGWAGFWVLFGALLAGLTHLPAWASFPLLAALMFAALRTYFYVAPVRPRDRYAIIAAYLAIPLALWPPFVGSSALFLAVVPVSLFLVLPVFLAIGSQQEGLLDSIGRSLLGVLFFVFCLAHVALLARETPPGTAELFGILVLASELPQRLAGRFRPGRRVAPALGIAAGVVLAVVAGWSFGPWCGLVDDDGARAGLFVFVAVWMGAVVSGAVTHDLALTAPSSRLGRGGLLNRMVPAVYAAPVLFHYLANFA